MFSTLFDIYKKEKNTKITIVITAITVHKMKFNNFSED